MNPQPYATPPRTWASELSPKLIRALTPARNRDLKRQRIESISVSGAEHVTQELRQGHGVLIVSNHSFHYDSYVMIEAGRRAGWFAHFMTAWQVFAMSTKYGQWMLQKHGCFSINREATDMQAFKQGVGILRQGDHPLLIFPEGDIYHSNDRTMPFREGAAAIALSAMKKGDRPIVVIPAAMKCFYTEDPTEQLVATMGRLEEHIRWRPRPDLPLVERIYRFGNGFLALKEVEYLGEPNSGPVKERIQTLALAILQQLREKHGITNSGEDVHGRIRHVRGNLIKRVDKLLNGKKERDLAPSDARELHRLREALQDVFFVTQLSSYHGDYSSEKPTLERLAETIDKFEEDVFALHYPKVRGTRKAVVRFGSPLHLSEPRPSVGELTDQMETSVQQLLDKMNAERD